MDMENLCQSVINLWGWLETWLDDRGGVHGYVVHHHKDNLKVLVPDTWTQAPCILGLLRIYQKTKNRKWIELSCKLSDYLVDSYLWSVHVYRNSNHEDKPLGRFGLIHNAIASFALLELAKERKNIDFDWKKYYIVAKDNIENFLQNFWDNSVGALLSPAHDIPQHIHNMNSSAISALIALSELENNKKYVEYAERIGKYILNCQVKDGRLQGAYPYRDNFKTKKYITLYSLITCLGLLALYKKQKNFNFLKSVENAISHLANFIDSETGLICHYHRHGYPQWIPDTMLIILILTWLKNEGVKVTVNVSEILNKVLSKQYATGGFPLSIGFEDLWYRRGCPSKPKIRRWRDVLATPNWNAWNFWALAEMLPEGAEVKVPRISFPFITNTDAEEDEGPYQIVEDEDKVFFMSNNNQPICIFYKRSDVADLCLIKERNEHWRIKSLLKKYPEIMQKLILTIPDLF
jgi:rhamnogalacturonyl hydrolase YesR